MFLSKLLNVYLQIVDCICPNWKDCALLATFCLPISPKEIYAWNRSCFNFNFNLKSASYLTSQDHGDDDGDDGPCVSHYFRCNQNLLGKVALVPLLEMRMILITDGVVTAMVWPCVCQFIGCDQSLLGRVAVGDTIGDEDDGVDSNRGTTCVRWWGWWCGDSNGVTMCVSVYWVRPKSTW